MNWANRDGSGGRGGKKQGWARIILEIRSLRANLIADVTNSIQPDVPLRDGAIAESVRYVLDAEWAAKNSADIEALLARIQQSVEYDEAQAQKK